MKLSNPRSFAIIGEENKVGLALEDNTSVIMWLYRYNEMGFLHPVIKDRVSAGIAHAGDQFPGKITFATLTSRLFLQLDQYSHTTW